MKLYVGTSGYSYKEWKGNFYPEKLPANEMLAFYAGKLPSVEINNTFYRVPKREVLEGWAAKVPGDFRFVLKATQRITHFKRLRNAGEEVDYFLRTTSTLGGRLGAILFQLPPNLKKDAAVLGEFLDHLPEGTPAAFEFRHVTWFDDEIYGLLKRRNCALCVADAEGDVDVPFAATADWGYLRLRRPDYGQPAIASWAGKILAQTWRHAFVFFKHEEAGAGPRMAAEFLHAAEHAG